MSGGRLLLRKGAPLVNEPPEYPALDCLPIRRNALAACAEVPDQFLAYPVNDARPVPVGGLPK